MVDCKSRATSPATQVRTHIRASIACGVLCIAIQHLCGSSGLLATCFHLLCNVYVHRSAEVRMGFNEDLAILDDGNRGSSKHITPWHHTIGGIHNLLP